MYYVGIDLHKKTIVLCVVDKERRLVARRRFLCQDVAGILAFFRQLGRFQFAVEATATYEWLVQLLEPLADAWVLVHPRKMRLIAESTKKSDPVDAKTLAEFLALDMLPPAYRPTPRQREHRVLVRYRVQCRQRVSRLKCQIRHLAATYNADVRNLFQAEQLEALRQRPELTAADRFLLGRRLQEMAQAQEHLAVAVREVKRFAKSGSPAEQKQREILRSAPGIGETLSEVVLAELADVDRFGSIKDATASAGLVPGKRQSDTKTKELGITKQGSRLLRWAMVEAAWQAVLHSGRWRGVYDQLRRRRGAKRAIVAVARRLLGVLVSMLKAGAPYRSSLAELKDRDAKAEARQRRRRAAQAAAEATA